jgi:hypothetical protein
MNIADILASPPDPMHWDGYNLWLVTDGHGHSQMVRTPDDTDGDHAIRYASRLPHAQFQPGAPLAVQIVA